VILLPDIWPFRAESNYTYDSSKVGVNGSGIAILLNANHTDSDNDASYGF